MKGKILLAIIVIAIVGLIFWSISLEEIVDKKTISVTIEDIEYNEGGYATDPSYQITFKDGTWLVTEVNSVIESLKIGHSYKLTIGKKRIGGHWIVLEAEEISHSP